MQDERRTRASYAPARQQWLLLGAAVGLAIALASVARPQRLDGPLPATVAATVNGEAIRSDVLERAYAMVAADRRTGAEPIGRRRVLERLIDEELLLQRAAELGLVRSDATVRGTIVRAMIDQVVLEAESAELGEAELRAYFDRNRDRFARPAGVRAERVLLRERGADDDIDARARAVVELLRAGAQAEHVRHAHGDAAVAPMPSEPLLLGELREHIGPAAARAVADARAGDVVGPLPSDAGLVVVRVLAVTPAAVPEFAASRDLIAVALRNERIDEAMRDYLGKMRSRADIVVREDVAEDGAA